MGIKKELGQKIKIMRKKKHITQEQLAEMVDISLRAISGIEGGEYYAKAETLDKIIAALDTTTEELFANEYLDNKEKMYNFILKETEIMKKDNIKFPILYKIVKALSNIQ